MKKIILSSTLLIGSISLLPDTVEANPFEELGLIAKNCIRYFSRSMESTVMRRQPFLRPYNLIRYRSYSTVKPEKPFDLVKDHPETEKTGTKILGKDMLKKLKQRVGEELSSEELSFRNQPTNNNNNANKDISDANASIYLTGTKLNSLIQREQPINDVHCPMGVLQTLALLSVTSEESIQAEITQFTLNSRIVDDMTRLNGLLQASPKSHTPRDKRDERTFDFTNGVYALLSSQLILNKNSTVPLAAMGAQLLEIDFSNPAAAAAQLNALVEKDTRGKIKQLLTEGAFSSESLFVLLHNQYIKASWAFGKADKSNFKFSDLDGKRQNVKSLMFSGTSMQFTQNKGVTLVTLPTVGDCHLTIRHSNDIKDVRPIEASEISDIRNSPAQYVRQFEAPFVTMKKSLNLKTLLDDHLPKILRGSFKTSLTELPVKIADYVQMVKFDMTEAGVEASAATAMHAVKESCMMPRNGPIITINSPFSFALTRSLAKQDYLLFQGQVVNHDVLKKHDWLHFLKD